MAEKIKYSSFLFAFLAAAFIAAMLFFAIPRKNQIEAADENPSPSSAKYRIVEWPTFKGGQPLAGFSEDDVALPLEILQRIDCETRISSSPVIAQDAIFVLGEDGTLVKIELQKFSVKWRFSSAETSEASPLAFEENVYFGTDSGVFFAVDADKGFERWRANLGGSIKGPANFWKSQEGRGLVIFGCYDFKLYALDSRTGEIVWEFKSDNYINGAPAIFGDGVVFGGCDSVLRILSARSGESLASFETGSYIPASPAISGELALVANYAGKISCFSITEKKLIWERMEEGLQFMSGISSAKGRALVASKDGEVLCFGLCDGSIQWRFKSKSRIDASPVICGDKAIIASLDGKISVLSMDTGAILGVLDTGRPIRSNPALSRGTIFACAEDGLVLVIGGRK